MAKEAKMKFEFSIAVYLMLSFVVLAVQSQSIPCPKNCVCSASGQKLRLKCGGTSANKIVSVKEVDFGEIEADVEQLDLSKNQITYIEPDIFLNMTSLKKLDLTSNSLKQIDEATFGELSSLERLKLTSNLIAHIFQGSFEKMKNLKQIDISSNPLACDCDLLWLIPWTETQSIKLQPAPKCATPLPFKGKQVKNLKIGTDLHCESPLQPLLELRPSVDQLLFEGDQLTLRCRAPRLAVPSLSIRDSEDLNAEDLPATAKSHVVWGWSDKVLEPNSVDNITYYDPQIRFPSVTIENRHLADSGLLDSVLRIPYVKRNHSGTWDCRLLSSADPGTSRSIKVIIISDKTKYCAITQTHTNRGTYYWPKTIRSNVVRLPCAGDGVANNLVGTYRCNEMGNWEQLDLSACPFIRESTRILEQFSKVNLTLARGSVLQSAKRLRNYTFFDYTEMLPKFRDPIDVTFIAKTLNNFLEFLNTEAELGGILLDIISQTMQLPVSLLQKAQQLDSASTHFLEIAETITSHASSSVTSVSQKPNLALESFKIRTDSFSGLNCVWFKANLSAESGHTESRILQCNDGNKQNFGGGFGGLNERYIDVSIQLPLTLFPQLLATQPVAAQPQQLLVSVYENANFFPSPQQQQYRLTSPIIGVKVSSSSATNSKTYGNLTDPIFIVLRFQPFHNDLSLPKPVWWDSQQGTGGAWTTQNCHPTHFLQFGMLVFACNKMGYYGLIQHKKYLNDFPDEMAGARFRLSPRGIYAGGFILFLCLWIQIITYMCYGHSSIQMGHRIRHGLINTWLALSLLVLTFTVGIQQTEDSHVCQIFGICIHYLSLCVLLWICVCLTQMYKRVSRRERIASSSLPPSEVLAMATAEHPRERKPIMGLYFVGWGIGLLVCGISGAVNLREYASYNYCFATVGPAMGAILVPASILIVFLLILYICIRFHLRNREITIHLSSDGGTTQATENVDLELLGPNTAMSQQPPQQSRSISTSIPASASSSSSYYDSEIPARRQLQAYVNILLLYIATWLLAGVTVTNPFVDHIMYAEEIFSVGYAVLASCLGMYIVYFYGMVRADVRNVWSGIGCWRKKTFHNYPLMMAAKMNGTSNGHVGGGEINGGAATSTYYATAPQMISRSNSQSSSKNHHGHHRAGAADLNSLMRRNESPNLLKVGQNMNLLSLHRQQFVHNQVVMQQSSIPEGTITSDPDRFYNPNQSNVARKFFKRQKRLQKQNNIDFVQRHHHQTSAMTDCDASSISSLFGSCGSKVNNTNIHIGRNSESAAYSKEMRTNFFNPNILSDSCNESDLLMDTVVQDGLRFTTSFQKNNNNSMFQNAFGGMGVGATPSVGSSVADSLIANIYTNIPETGVPQHEIVTMRAEEKVSNKVEEEGHRINDLSDHSNELVSSVTSAATTVENTPHYMNTMEAQQVLTDTGDSTTVSATTCMEMQATSPNRSGDDSSKEIDSVVLSLSSPLNSAMNTVGLPLDLSPRKSYNSDKRDDLILKLDKDETYISSPLEISAHHPSATTIFRSKSLDLDANDPFNQSLYYQESQPKSISCNNVSLFDDNNGLFGRVIGVPPPMDHLQRATSSPVLFSPSLCDINDDSLANNGLNINDENISASSEQNLMYLNPDNTPNFSNIFNTSSLSSTNRHLLRNLTSSPTAYSDINYQNSEISIRSQDFYAPQPDNDLNIILAARDHFNFEISDIEDENDLDEAYNCSRDYLLCPQDDEIGGGATTDGTSVDQDGEDVDLLNESQSSIDELYQQIKRNDQPRSTVIYRGGDRRGKYCMRASDELDDGSSQNNDDEDEGQMDMETEEEVAALEAARLYE